MPISQKPAAPEVNPRPSADDKREPRRDRSLPGSAFMAGGDSQAVDESFSPGDVDPKLARLIEIATASIEAGQPVDVSRLAADNPAQAEALHKLLPALQQLAELSSTSGLQSDLESEPIQTGKTFGNFRIIREIGRGGMGIVYVAEQIGLARTVALKVLPMGASMDQRAQQRFQLEAQVAGLLQHPHIVPVHEVGIVGKVPYFAMRYIEGCSLADVVAELRKLSGIRDRPGDDRASTGKPGQLASGLITGQFTPRTVR